MDLLHSNHGSLVFRKRKYYGLPDYIIKDYPDISLDREDELKDIGDDIYKVIEEPIIYSNDKTKENTNRMNKFIDDIINDVDYKVKK